MKVKQTTLDRAQVYPTCGKYTSLAAAAQYSELYPRTVAYSAAETAAVSENLFRRNHANKCVKTY